MATKPLRSFHFDLGNSNDGPIGMCARVTAPDRRAATRLLKKNLPEEIKVDIEETGKGSHVEYVRIYLNLDNVRQSDIDGEEDV